MARSYAAQFRAMVVQQVHSGRPMRGPRISSSPRAQAGVHQRLGGASRSRRWTIGSERLSDHRLPLTLVCYRRATDNLASTQGRQVRNGWNASRTTDVIIDPSGKGPDKSRVLSEYRRLASVRAQSLIRSWMAMATSSSSFRCSKTSCERSAVRRCAAGSWNRSPPPRSRLRPSSRLLGCTRTQHPGPYDGHVAAPTSRPVSRRSGWTSPSCTRLFRSRSHEP